MEISPRLNAAKIIAQTRGRVCQEATALVAKATAVPDSCQTPQARSARSSARSTIQNALRTANIPGLTYVDVNVLTTQAQHAYIVLMVNNVRIIPRLPNQI